MTGAVATPEEARRLARRHERPAKACYEGRGFEEALEGLALCLESPAGFTDWSLLEMRLLRVNLLRRLGRLGRAGEELRAIEEEREADKDPFIRNLLLNEREITEGRTVLESKPIRLTVRLTNRCQIRCIMCAMPNDKAWFVPRPILDEVGELTPYLEDVQWQGGEIFVLNRDFLQGLMERAAANPHLGQSIITNGTLIDRRWAEVLVRCRVHVRISVDGATREVYEKIRFGSKWDDLLRAIGNLNGEMERQGRRIPMELHMVVMRSNHLQVADMLDFAREHRIGVVDLSHIYGWETSGENIFIEKDPSVWRELGRQRSLAREKAVRYGIQFSDNLPFPPPELGLENPQPPPPSPGAHPAGELRLKAWPPDRPLDYFCLSAWKKVIVRDDGSLITNWHCDRDIGHVDRTSIKQAWNGPQMQEYRRRIVEKTQQGLCTAYCLSGALIDTWRDQMEWNWS